MIEKMIWSNELPYCYDKKNFGSEEGVFFWLTEEQALCLLNAVSLFNTHDLSIELKNKLEETIEAIRENKND